MYLKNTPEISEVSKKSQDPWTALGMSRSTYFRHGKPHSESWKCWRQKIRAHELGVSERSVQRIDFISKHGIQELTGLIMFSDMLSLALVAEVACLPASAQRCFVEKLQAAAAETPSSRPSVEISREIANRLPIAARIARRLTQIDPRKLRSLARRVFSEVINIKKN